MPNLGINAIRVGSDQFTSADTDRMLSAIRGTRSTYATVGLTLNFANFFDIRTDQARGREIISDTAEARALMDEWSVANTAIDVFFVLSFAGNTVGLSGGQPGPCGKNEKGDGVVVDVRAGIFSTRIALGHEVGHYLGLWHVDNDRSNLMFPETPNGGLLTPGQGFFMNCHCIVQNRGPCIG